MEYISLEEWIERNPESCGPIMKPCEDCEEWGLCRSHNEEYGDCDVMRLIKLEYAVQLAEDKAKWGDYAKDPD